MVLVYELFGQVAGVCDLDKSRFAGIDVRDMFEVDGDTVTVRGCGPYEDFYLCESDVSIIFESKEKIVEI